jgi:hypothetical protein
MNPQIPSRSGRAVPLGRPTAENPFTLPGEWLKGNTHCHTDRSDGVLSPEAAADWYAGHGYDFLSITDHRILTSIGAVERAGMIGVPGMELNGWDDLADCEYHLVALGLKNVEATPPGRSLQADIDLVKADGAVTILAHPHWLGFEPQWLAPVRDLDALEIFNTACQFGFGKGYASQIADGLLAHGNRFTLVAADDTHWRLEEAGRGWIQVRASERTSPAVIQAILAGAFYASQGPEIYDFRIEGSRAVARTSPVAEVRFMSWRSKGQVVRAETADRTEWEVTLQGGERYVRLECVAADGGMAWSNPLYP